MSFSFSRSANRLQVAATAALFPVLLAAFPCAVHAQRWGQYGITVYAPLPSNFMIISGHDINNQGLVVGDYPLAGSFTNVATIFDPKSGTLATVFSGVAQSDGLTISNNGVVGGSIYGTSTLPAATASGGVTTTLPLLGTGDLAAAYGINDHGVVVGGATTDASDAIIHPFLFDGTMHDLAAAFPDYSGYALDVNNAGLAAGYFDDNNGEHPATFDLAGVHLLPGTGEAAAINNSGNVVGYTMTNVRSYSSSDAVFYDALGMHDLGRTGHDFSDALDIDDANDIVGFFVDFIDSSAYYGALWEDNGGAFTPYLLADIVNARDGTTGWSFRDVRGISDNGSFILADGCFSDSGAGTTTCGTFTLEANAPEPATIVLTGSGLFVLAGVARRRRNIRR